VPVEQVYVTHCAPADSYRGEAAAGFGIRASSTDDPELLRFALDYPAYELPLDMWEPNPLPGDAPRRLALVRVRQGLFALVHTAYVQFDTRNRPGNYFTHILFHPQLTAAEALQTWGSPQWVTTYPAGGKKKLDQFAERLPQKGKLDDRVLLAFLSGAQLPGDVLATTVCPVREPLQGGDKGERRRKMLSAALQATVLALKDLEEGGARKTFYLSAEPGLAALLLYGVVRLLPGSLVRELTFSTFEPPHRSFRQMKSVQVLATYTRTRDKGLESDFTTSRGYALDTFQPARSSDRLRDLDNLDPICQKLVSWAAVGDWDSVAKLRQYHADPLSLSSLHKAHESVHLLATWAKLSEPERLKKLLEFLEPAGQPFLAQHEDEVMDWVREASLTHAKVRDAYSSWLLQPKHFEELQKQASQCLTTEQWERYWNLIAALRRDGKEQLRQDFLKILEMAEGEDAQKGALRAAADRLLRQWDDLGASADRRPGIIERLLTPATAAEFERLYRAKLPPSWLAVSVRYALEKDATHGIAIQAVKDNATLMQALCREVATGCKDAEMQVKLLRQVVTSQETLNLLLGNCRDLPADLLDRLLTKIQAYAAASDGYWSEEGRLGQLFEALKASPEASGRLWATYAGKITQHVLFGHKQQVLLLEQLREVRRKWGKAVPEAAGQQVDDWGLLSDLFARPKAVAELPVERLDAALTNRGFEKPKDLFEPREPLQEYFRRFVRDKSSRGNEVASFIAAFELVYRQWAADDSEKAQLDLFRVWLRLTALCDEERKANFQLRYLDKNLVEEHQVSVMVQCLKKGEFCPEAAAIVKQKLKDAKAEIDAEKRAASEKEKRWAKRKKLLLRLTLIGLLVGLAGFGAWWLLLRDSGQRRVAVNNENPEDPGKGKGKKKDKKDDPPVQKQEDPPKGDTEAEKARLVLLNRLEKLTQKPSEENDRKFDEVWNENEKLLATDPKATKLRQEVSSRLDLLSGLRRVVEQVDSKKADEGLIVGLAELLPANYPRDGKLARRVESAKLAKKSVDPPPGSGQIRAFDAKVVAHLRAALEEIPNGFVQAQVPLLGALPDQSLLGQLKKKLNAVCDLLADQAALQDPKEVNKKLDKLARDIAVICAGMEELQRRLGKEGRDPENDKLRLALELWTMYQYSFKEEVEASRIKHLKKKVQEFLEEDKRLVKPQATFGVEATLDGLARANARIGTGNLKPAAAQRDQAVLYVCEFVARELFERRHEVRDNAPKRRELRWTQFRTKMNDLLDKLDK